MRKGSKGLAASLALAVGTTLAATSSFAQPVDTSRIEAGSANDWLTYHGSYRSYHYSALDQINTSNVKDLQVAWMRCRISRRAWKSIPMPPRFPIGWAR